MITRFVVRGIRHGRTCSTCSLGAARLLSSTDDADNSVLIERKGKVALITLNAPKQLNALDAPMGDRFGQMVEDLCEGPESNDLGAVVLTGAGRAFSAGGDLNFLKDRAADTPSRNSIIMRRFYERFLSVRRIPVPVVAAINGPAIGAGLCLALACDVRIAAKDAKMGITFVGLGLHPGMGATHFLPRLVGPQTAATLMLTGDVIDGKEAHRLGIVANAVDSPEETVEQAMQLANRISSQAPVAVRTCVRTLRMAHDDGLDRSLWREADAQAQVWGTGDLSEGVNALVEKRRPVFTDFESLVE